MLQQIPRHCALFNIQRSSVGSRSRICASPTSRTSRGFGVTDLDELQGQGVAASPLTGLQLVVPPRLTVSNGHLRARRAWPPGWPRKPCAGPELLPWQVNGILMLACPYAEKDRQSIKRNRVVSSMLSPDILPSIDRFAVGKTAADMRFMSWSHSNHGDGHHPSQNRPLFTPSGV